MDYGAISPLSENPATRIEYGADDRSRTYDRLITNPVYSIFTNSPQHNTTGNTGLKPLLRVALCC